MRFWTNEDIRSDRKWELNSSLKAKGISIGDKMHKCSPFFHMRRRRIGTVCGDSRTFKGPGSRV